MSLENKDNKQLTYRDAGVDMDAGDELVERIARKPDAAPENATRHVDERFAGAFRRIVTLPDDADPDAVEAKYRDGVVHLTIARKQAAQPRRITVQ